MRTILGLIISLTLFSCGGRTGHGIDGDSIHFKYATLPSIVEYDEYTVVTIANPWKVGKALHSYVLVPRDAELPVHLPSGTVIRTPIERAVVFTTVHSSLLMDLGCQEKIAGVADLKYISIPWIQEQAAAGKIADCGDGMSPVIEKIIDLHPDAILLSPFENSGGYGKLEDIDIPLVECAEYMEVSPLARAEWMRFYGLLFGCREKADSLFATVDKEYNELKQRAARAGGGRTILMDKMTGSVWYSLTMKLKVAGRLGAAPAAWVIARITVVEETQLPTLLESIKKLDLRNEEVGVRAFVWDIVATV